MLRVSVAGHAPGTAPRARVAHLSAPLRAAPEVVALLGLAAIIRLVLLGAPSGWEDEAVSLRTVEAGWHGLVRMAAHDTHPLLYYLLLRSWLLAIGFGFLRARLFSTLCDLATLVVLYSLARRLFDRSTASVAALLFTLSPVAVWYAANARMYALTELLTLLALRLLVEAHLTRRGRYWLGFGVCAGLALNADYSGVYLVGAGVLWYLLLVRGGQARLRPLLRSLGITAILLIPAVALALEQVFGAGPGLSQIDWIPAPTAAIVWGTLGDLISLHAPNGATVVVVGCALGLGASVLCGREAHLPAHRPAYLLLACMILAPLVLALLASTIRPVFITPQVLTTLFGLLIAFGRTIVLLWGRAIRLRPIAALALAALLTLSLASLRVISETPQLTEDWQHAVPYLLEHSSGRTLLVFTPFFYDGPFFLYTNPTPNLQVDWPPGARPGPTFSTIWLIDVYPPPHPALPRGWSALHLRLTDEHRFAGIALFRLTRRSTS